MIQTYSDWLQLWPYAVLTIVIASWVLYHFLAPASWRDWGGAGLVRVAAAGPHPDRRAGRLTERRAQANSRSPSSSRYRWATYSP
jgi:hypothetical protein